MNQTKTSMTLTTNSQESKSGNQRTSYQAPRLVVIGTAIELVQGGLLGEALDNLRGGRVRVR